MLGIQNQTQVRATNPLSFKGSDNPWYSAGSSSPDSFNREDLEYERDEKVDQINQSVQGFEDLADQLENTDNKYAKKASKGVRLAASLFGLAATFVMAKYSSKFVIESLKSITKSPAVSATVDAAGNAAKGVSEAATKVMKNRKVLRTIVKIKNSKAGQAAAEFMKKPVVAKVLEPLKNTLKSVRGIKINGASIQSAIENTMAATTTGSVLVDNLTGRNKGKSTVELATGV